MPSLLDPFTIRSVTLKSRIGVSPMCQYSATDGFPNDWHFVHYGTLATGRPGLLIVEATGVEPRGRITHHCLGIWSDEHVEPFARDRPADRRPGPVPGIQIAHAGRKASTTRLWEGDGPIPVEEGGWEPVGPSPIAYGPGYTVPHELTVEEIGIIQEAWVAAAQRALAAGYRWLELHSAHGYLSHSFLSPLSNQRTDRYGGSFQNRTRFLVETARAVRNVWPEELPLAVRVSATDWVEGGWDIDQTVELARALKGEGVDLVDCSSAALVPYARVPSTPGFQVPFAEAVRRGAGIASAAVGLISDPVMADEIVRAGKADLVLLARELLRNPYWPLHAARALGAPVEPPGQYARAW